MSVDEVVLSPIGKKIVPYQSEIEANETHEELTNRLVNDITIGNVPENIILTPENDVFDVPQFTSDNIGQFLNPVVDLNESRKNAFKQMTKTIMVKFKQVQGRYNRKHLMIVMMTHITGYLDIMHDPEFASFTIMIKGLFNEFIRRERVYELIPIYNTIYNDNVFANIEITPEVTITQAEIDAYIAQYNNDLLIYAENNATTRLQPKYEKGEIIGARNSEDKWYMAEVLKVFHHKHANMYYVEFKGWGEQFNEFIVDSYRLKRFNPRIHVYYRPAWKHHQLAVGRG
jgi:hypothetical protein